MMEYWSVGLVDGWIDGLCLVVGNLQVLKACEVCYISTSKSPRPTGMGATHCSSPSSPQDFYSESFFRMISCKYGFAASPVWL